MRRLLFPLLGLLLVVGVAAGVGARSYDAGYATGFEEGAVEAVEAIDGETTDIAVLAPDADRFRDGRRGGGPLVPIVLLVGIVLTTLAVRRGRGPHHGPSRGGERRAWLESWHDDAHADESEHASVPAGAPDADPERGWPSGDGPADRGRTPRPPVDDEA